MSAETYAEKKLIREREEREKTLWKLMGDVSERDGDGESDLHRALRLAWLEARRENGR
jgi:hypothetical protein